MLAYLKDQLENVLINLDSALHDDAILKIMLLTLVNHGPIKGMSNVLSAEDLDAKV
jgi:hypothetical protein